ncbi:MAG TPA: protein-L-isoaspartate(D-aspartate) O-methyltransferase [Solirubrobacterales bacterium]|nr:protein-L-isoaspartate(D-aspartate) O-methyltransferase [Solirubrobacterales bacterium]
MARSPASAESLVEKIRPYIGDERVLAAVAAVPRHLFVPEALSRFAWENTALPIGAGQTISQPIVVARMCEVLELTGDEKVLDVGTGSGYHAAVLAHLAGIVWSIERKPKLAEQARRNLDAAGIRNVHVVVGDGSQGYPEQAPFDAINVAAAAHDVPAKLEEQLADGGGLVAPIDGRDQRLLLERRRGDDTLERTYLEPVRFVPLVGEGE